MRLVALGWPASAEEVGRLQAAFSSGAVSYAIPRASTKPPAYSCSDSELGRVLREAEVLLTWAPVGVWLLEEAPQLRMVLQLQPNPVAQALPRSRQIDWRLISDQAFGHAVAEYAFAFMLGQAKRLRMNHHHVQEGSWRGYWRPSTTNREMRGATVCVIGAGAAATSLARFCLAFGMKVSILADALAAERIPEVRYGGPADLRQLLIEADFVVITAPLADEAHGLITAQSIAWLKPTAHLINMADAELVEEGPLHLALTTARLGGYASQSWWDYPNTLSPGYHFPIASRRGIHQLPNVLGSGQVALNALTIRDRILDLAAAQLRLVVEGEMTGNSGHGSMR